MVASLKFVNYVNQIQVWLRYSEASLSASRNLADHADVNMYHHLHLDGNTCLNWVFHQGSVLNMAWSQALKNHDFKKNPLVNMALSSLKCQEITRNGIVEESEWYKKQIYIHIHDISSYTVKSLI